MSSWCRLLLLLRTAASVGCMILRQSSCVFFERLQLRYCCPMSFVARMQQVSCRGTTCRMLQLLDVILTPRIRCVLPSVALLITCSYWGHGETSMQHAERAHPRVQTLWPIWAGGVGVRLNGGKNGIP
ncbi:unnamed protein product [Ectocarpus sp. 13 AM-2016]